MLGYACEVHDNPADHFLDVITKCEEESKQCGEFSHTVVNLDCTLMQLRGR